MKTKAMRGLCLALTVAGVLASADAAAQGNPFRGRETFEKKGCVRCHSVWGQGGTLGPDISAAVAARTWDELVGDFWNHTPQVIDELGRRGYGWPTLDAQEMDDTLGYFYYLKVFDAPGDPARGAAAFRQLECGACHSLGGGGGTTGGPLDHLGQYTSPTVLATAMWNAGPRMQQEQLRRNGVILRFAGREMADLQAYIRSAGRRREREVALQALPSPERGAVVYRSKQCGVCHDRPGTGAPDISRAALSRTVAETTGLLWNHSYAMSAMMSARGVPFPRFAGGELADLIAQLYFRGYVGRDGDAGVGAEVFKAKGCAECHAPGKAGAPDLSAGIKRADRAGLASAMWNHTSRLRAAAGDQDRVWPKFEPGEMRNLTAYLQKLAGSRGTSLAPEGGAERRAASPQAPAR
jgi:cytochrome c551/c552